MSRNNDPAPITYEEWHNAQDEIDRLRAEVAALKAENEQLRIDKITLGNFGCLPAYRTAPPGKEE